MVVQVNQRSPVIASTANLFTPPTHPFTSTHRRVYPGRAPVLLLSRFLGASQWPSAPLPSDGFPLRGSKRQRRQQRPTAPHPRFSHHHNLHTHTHISSTRHTWEK